MVICTPNSIGELPVLLNIASFSARRLRLCDVELCDTGLCGASILSAFSHCEVKSKVLLLLVRLGPPVLLITGTASGSCDASNDFLRAAIRPLANTGFSSPSDCGLMLPPLLTDKVSLTIPSDDMIMALSPVTGVEVRTGVSVSLTSSSLLEHLTDNDEADSDRGEILSSYDCST